MGVENEGGAEEVKEVNENNEVVEDVKDVKKDVKDPVIKSLESVPGRKERLQRVMADLEIHRAAIMNCTLEWKEFDKYFSELEAALQKRLEEVVAKEQAFEIKNAEMQEALDKREEAVSSREQAMLSRVQEQKDSAIASLFEEKRKWLEERSRLEAAAEAKAKVSAEVPSSSTEGSLKSSSPQTKVSEPPPQSQSRVSEVVKSVKAEPIDRTADVAAAATTGSANPIITQAMEVDVSSPKPTANSPVSAPENEGAGAVPARKIETSTNSISPPPSTSPKASAVPEVRVRPPLKALCENMDGDGLRKYIVFHRKDVGALRNELPPALQFAIDPARMVLAALEGYHLAESSASAVPITTNPNPAGGGGGDNNKNNNNKESGASANRRACILLLECLAVVLADPVLGADHPVVPTNVKESAKQVAEQWKSRMNLQDDATGNSLDAQAFLQLLATFGIASEYNDDELCKLVTAVARRRQTPALCRSLGLSAKIPGWCLSPKVSCCLDGLIFNSLNECGTSVKFSCTRTDLKFGFTTSSCQSVVTSHSFAHIGMA
jgi:hypothetical protein